MITYNNYYRIQLKEPVLFRLKARPTHTALCKRNRTDFLKLKSIPN